MKGHAPSGRYGGPRTPPSAAVSTINLEPNGASTVSNEAVPVYGPDVRDVHAFWNTTPCGAHFVDQLDDERATFAAYRQFRYRTEWHIPEFAAFPESRGKRVLEIGCGNGADAVMFAAHGARYVGVDLTEKAVEATRRHLALEGLAGECHLANVEELDFPDATFDIVYSYGALHHTPSTERAMHEVWRVLRPGGVALVMLYHRHSLNYYGRILGYMRARLVAEILARPWRAARSRTAGAAQSGLRGNTAPEVWDVHYRNFRRRGWSYLRADTFTHHCTDGPDCPYAYVFDRREVARLFSAFTAIRTRVAHLPLNKYPLTKWVPRSVERKLGAALGWHLQIRAVK
jgi:2-polyprenyl-3-methyl-5-hydroxy-6-metoxy-1,4-benzoquinol methylase